jgi:hypothetical protein
MKAEELRIGNKLQTPDGSFFNVTIHVLHTIYTWNASENLLPKGIPLTKEILLKAGFDKHEADSLLDYDTWWKDDCEWLFEADGKFYQSFLNVDDNEFKYLHDLQNLYHALKHEELTVSL